MFEKNLKLVTLFDIYGSLLSENQQKMFSLYYNEDYSLAEISEETGISRQGVRDSIKKCEELLKQYEDSLGLSKVYTTVEEAVEILKKADKNEEASKACELLNGILD